MKPGDSMVRQKKQSLFTLLSVFRDSVLLLAFQQILKLLAPPLVRRFFFSWDSPSILQHRPALIASPALVFATAILVLSSVPSRGGSPVCRSPSVHAASAIDTGATVYAAPAVLPATAFGDVLCVRKATPIEADAPSAMIT